MWEGGKVNNVLGLGCLGDSQVEVYLHSFIYRVLP